jgi:hypothetical protein
MQFNIEKVRRLMEETEDMNLDAASQYVNQKAPEWRHTAVAEAIVCGSTDPVRTAQEYNAVAGGQAVEYASGRIEL